MATVGGACSSQDEQTPQPLGDLTRAQLHAQVQTLLNVASMYSKELTPEQKAKAKVLSPDQLQQVLTVLRNPKELYDQQQQLTAHEGSVLASIVRGFVLFQFEDFGSSAHVTCATCHKLGELGGISLPTIAALPASDPLFNPLNSDQFGTAEYGLVPYTYDALRENSVIPIPFVLCPSHGVDSIQPVTVDSLPRRPAKLLPVTVNGENCKQVTLMRRPPILFNVGAAVSTGHDLMHDGRDGQDFAAQARGAVKAHGGPETRELTNQEADDIGNFQKALISHLDIALHIKNGSQYTLPQGQTAEEQSGRTLFAKSPNGLGPAGECAQCHSAEAQNGFFNGVNEDNILRPIFGGIPFPGFGNSINFSADVVADLLGDPRGDVTGDRRNHFYEWTVTVPAPFSGIPETRVLVTTDPGAFTRVINGKIMGCQSDITGCLINAGSGRSVFSTPDIRLIGEMERMGIPFFHHGELDLHGVFEHHKSFAHFSANAILLLSLIGATDPFGNPIQPREDLRIPDALALDGEQYARNCLVLGASCKN